MVNDAVGTLMSAAHVDHNCEIGLILGTGFNSCYMEYLDNVGTWGSEDEKDHHPRQVMFCLKFYLIVFVRIIEHLPVIF